MEEVNASPEEVKRAEQLALPAFRKDLEDLLRERPDMRAQLADDQAIFALADKAVRDYLAAAARTPSLPRLSKVQAMEVRRRLYVTHCPLGPLRELLDKPGVEDVHINGTRGGYMECGDHREPLPVEFHSEEELERLVRWYAEHSGKHFDPGNPMVTITLRDGTRINAILPPVAKPLVVTIRLQQVGRFLALEDLYREGAIPEASIALLRAAVEARLNIVLSGPTGAGKTTVARVLALLIPKGERTCVLETETELWLHDLRDEFFSLEERDANVEGAGRVTMHDLFVRGALRQRPRRIIVGEVRDKEALDMLRAMSSAHHGSLTTVHASSPRMALNLLQMLAASAEPNLPPHLANQMVGMAVDMVMQLDMYQRGEREVRRLASLCFVDHNVEDGSAGPVVQEVCRHRLETDDWSWEPDAILFMPTKIRNKFRAAGMDEHRLRIRVAGGNEA
jgi:pilus assembly protein CpaF